MSSCERIHELLDRYLGASLDAAERETFEAHLSECGECRCVVDVMRSADGPSMVQPILARTTGRTCHLVQEELAADATANVAAWAHVDECETCARFVAVLARCDRVLPELASVIADADFASDVIMATLERPHLSHVAWRRWKDRLAAWLDRPRAAQELAYAVTVVLVLLGATPVSPFPQLPGWFASLVQSPFATAGTASVVAEPGLGDRVFDEVIVRGGRLVRDLDRVGQGIATTGAGFLTGNAVRVHEGADAVGCGLQSLWLGVVEPEAEPEGPCADPSAVVPATGTTTAMIDIAMGERT